MLPGVDVIIVNWNTAPLLERCLASLYAGLGAHPVEVCVVDNGSTDASLGLLSSSYPRVRVISNSKNLGFAAANNQGIKATNSPYVLLLNSDAFLREGVIDRLVSRMENEPDTGAIGCQLLYEDGTLQRSCYSYPDLLTELWSALMLDKAFPRSRVFGKYLMTYWAMDDDREVDVIMGAVMLLRREALDRVGILDESFFMYSEEVDLCYRLKRNGWKIRYDPTVRAVHIWGGTARKVPAETMVRLYRSRTQFFRKHYGIVPAALYKGLLYLVSLIRIVGGYLAFGMMGRKPLLDKARNYRQVFSRVWSF